MSFEMKVAELDLAPMKTLLLGFLFVLLGNISIAQISDTLYLEHRQSGTIVKIPGNQSIDFKRGGNWRSGLFHEMVGDRMRFQADIIDIMRFDILRVKQLQWWIPVVGTAVAIGGTLLITENTPVDLVAFYGIILGYPTAIGGMILNLVMRDKAPRGNGKFDLKNDWRVVNPSFEKVSD